MIKSSLTLNQATLDRAASWTKYLIGLVLTLFVALGVLLYFVNIKKNVLKDGMREDAIWATYQMDRDARQLAHQVSALALTANISEKEVQAAKTRYDVLYSRTKLLKSNYYTSLLSEDQELVSKAASVNDKILSLDPLVQKFNANEKDATQFKDANLVLKDLVVETADILIKANALINRERAESRDQTLKLGSYSMYIAGAIFLAFGGLVYSLLQQVSMLSKVGLGMQNTADSLSVAFEAAEAGNRTKSEFMATMGHEIRTPLNAILGMAEMLSYSKLGDEDKETVSIILSSGTSLLEIINEILDFAKLEDGKMTREAVAFKPWSIGNEVTRVLRPRALEKHNALLIEFENVKENDSFVGDPTLLKRVLFNLISNAVKFTENGKIAINIKWDESASKLAFSVKDSGIGIPESAMSKLFTAFTQVDNSTSRKYGGTGLGLAICKRIVEDLGGQISVESIVGFGSKFWFEVPSEKTETTLLKEVEKLEADLPQNSILIVEDQPFNREVLLKFLHKLGQIADIACDGQEAVDAARNTTYDLILMDMQMPTMDGVQATTIIRTFNATTPIVALTANASETDRIRCMAAGMNGFEPKPLSLVRLEAVIRQFGKTEQQIQPELLETSQEIPIVAPIDPQVSEIEVIDKVRVQELIETLDADIFSRLVASFVDELPGILRSAEQALIEGDASKMDEALHNLKGLAGNFGLARVSEAAQRGRGQRLDAELISNLKTEVEIGCKAIRAYAA